MRRAIAVLIWMIFCMTRRVDCGSKDTEDYHDTENSTVCKMMDHGRIVTKFECRIVGVIYMS